MDSPPSHVSASGDGSIASGANYGLQNTGTIELLQLIQAARLRPAGEVSLSKRKHNHNLRQAAPVFTGRKAAMARLDSLAGDGRQVICGLGGTGKSELALQYAAAHADDYELIWWVDAGGPQPDSREPGGRERISEPIWNGLAQLAYRIDPSIGAGLPRDAAADWAVDWLQAHPGWLLVLDDVQAYDDIRGLLGQLSGGAIVITTRRDFGVELPGAAGARAAIMLDGLAPAEAVEMLTVATGCMDPGDARAAAEIGAELGYLPLALRLAAAFMCQERTRPGRYLDLLRGYPARRAALRDAVWRTWQVTVDAIAAPQPDAIGVLQLLSCLAPDDVPRAVLADDDGTASAALGVLASYCMVRLGEEAVSTHRLVQEAVRAADRQYPATLTTAIGRLLKALPTGHPVDHVADWPRWRSMIPHVLATADLAGADLGRCADLGRLLNRAVPFLLIERQDARKLAEQARANLEDGFEDELGPRDELVVDAWHNLALACRAAGELNRALPLFEHAVTARAALLGPDHSDTLDSRRALGNAQAEAGHTGQAAATLADAAGRYARTQGARHPGTLRARADLALANMAHGNLRGAAEQFGELVPIIEQVLGSDCPDVLILRGNLAHIHEELGEYDRALLARRAVLDAVVALIGLQHPRALEARRALSRACALSGDTGTAATLAREAVDGLCRAYPDDARHTAILRARMTLAFALDQDGAPAQAAEVFDDVLRDRIAVLGADHPDVIMTRYSLAQSLLNAGDRHRAVTVARETVADCERLLDPRHIQAFQARLLLATALMAQGSLGEAIRQARPVAEDAERIMGAPDHCLVFQARMMSICCQAMLDAGDLIAAGDPRAVPVLSRAADQAGRVLAEAEQALGLLHPCIAGLRNWTALFGSAG